VAISTGLSFKFRESRSSPFSGLPQSLALPPTQSLDLVPRSSVAAAKSQAAGAILIDDGAAKQELLLAQDAFYNGMGQV